MNLKNIWKCPKCGFLPMTLHMDNTCFVWCSPKGQMWSSEDGFCDCMAHPHVLGPTTKHQWLSLVLWRILVIFK
jgi:hypothetical protein